MTSTATQDHNRHRNPAILAAVKHDRLAELDALFAECELTGEQRVWIALRSQVEATRQHVLAGCIETATFHQGALAVVRDDEVAIRQAHAVGEDWHAPLGPPLGWSAVHLAAALGHVVSLRALITLGVEIDRMASQGFDQCVPVALAMRHRHWGAAQVLIEAGIEPHRSDLMELLPNAPRAVLAALVANGLQWDFVQGEAGLMADTLTPENLRMLIELGMGVDEHVLAWILSCLGVERRPDAEYVALTRELLRICPPPASGVVNDPGGERMDILERVLARLPLQVAQDLVAAGVTKRKVRISSTAPEAAEKKAWLDLPTPPRPGEPALPFPDFLGLTDEDLTEAAITAQLAIGTDGRLRLGPVRLGMRAADIEPIAPSKWQRDSDLRWSTQSESDRNFREHRVQIEMLADGSIFHVQYQLLYNQLPGGDAPPTIGAYLTGLLGKPTRKTKQATTWLRGETRASLGFFSGGHDRFGDGLVLEILDERHQEQALRHHNFWKL